MTKGSIGFGDRAILVTGAGRGLGRAQALLLAARGARLTIADNGSAMHGDGAGRGPAETVVAEILAGGGEAVAFTGDLGTEQGAAGAVQAGLDAFGRIDGIVHFASPCPDLKGAEQMTTADLDLVMRVNPFAGLWLARAAWPRMTEQGFGRIVFSTSGAIYGALGNADYAAAKAAMIGMTRCLAIEGRTRGILVNAVAPAARTRMTERFEPSAFADWFYAIMQPEKVAAGVAWLLSEQCDLAGEIFAMGGGRIARILLAESEGAIGTGNSIEEVAGLMPEVMDDTRFFHPGDLSERSGKVAELFGFDVRFDSSTGFATRPAGD